MNIRVNVVWKTWIQFNTHIVEHLLYARKRGRANGGEGRVGENTRFNRVCGLFLSRDSESTLDSQTVICYPNIKENVGKGTIYVETIKGWMKLGARTLVHSWR